MASLVPHAETTAANLARVLRLHTLPTNPWGPHQRALAARRLLEELGVHCDESAALHDLKGFLLSSPRGTETTAANLARVLRLHTLPSTPWGPHQRALAARRLLEELGVHCDE